MIKIRMIYGGENDTPDWAWIQIKGHANYEKRGKDVVCAGVSALFYSLMLSIVEEKWGEIRVNELPDSKELNVEPIYKNECKAVLKSFEKGAREIAQNYPNHCSFSIGKLGA